MVGIYWGKGSRSAIQNQLYPETLLHLRIVLRYCAPPRAPLKEKVQVRGDLCSRGWTLTPRRVDAPPRRVAPATPSTPPLRKHRCRPPAPRRLSTWAAPRSQPQAEAWIPAVGRRKHSSTWVNWVLTRAYARSNDDAVTTQGSTSHTIVIPLGVVDARARVHQDGTVRLLGHRGHPLPRRLATAAWGVLFTWMLQQDDEEPTLGQTMIDPDAWHETFAHRLQGAA